MKSRQNRRSRVLRPRLECLETRRVPTCIITGVGPSMLILGDQADNTVKISDDGNGGVTASCDAALETRTGISHVVIKTRGGDDSVDYDLSDDDLNTPRKLQIELGKGDDFANLDFATGPDEMICLPPPEGQDLPICKIVHERSISANLRVQLRGGGGDDAVLARFGELREARLRVNAQLGAGDDTFDALLEGDLVATLPNVALARFYVQGGAGDDSMNLYAPGVDLESGDIRLYFFGEQGQDFIGVDHSGRFNNGSLLIGIINVDGGEDDDMVAIGLDYSGPGAHVTDFTVHVGGGAGSDNLTSIVKSTFPVGVTIDGGPDTDFCAAEPSLSTRSARHCEFPQDEP